jgi:hypothetical protein
MEVRVGAPADIERAARASDGLELFVEIALDDSLPESLEAAARSGCRAKVRTGGVSPEAFPSSEQLAAFLVGCTRRALPFKTTAGLHHAIRSVRPLGSGAGAPVATMHGFLNVFVASALLYAGRIDVDTAVALLDETDPDCFLFGGQELRWGEFRATDDEVAAARRVALGFGSCSFEEPIADLVSLGLLGIPSQ